jgi:hypothetical protein
MIGGVIDIELVVSWERGDTSTASSKSCFADLDGWNKIVGKHIIQSPLNLKLVICTVKEFLISNTINNSSPN